MDISGKQAGLPHVFIAQQPSGETLQAQTQAPMGRHAVAVHQQIAFKFLRVHTPLQKFLQLLLIAVNPLPPGGDLHPSK